jgi:hypothetical protein
MNEPINNIVSVVPDKPDTLIQSSSVLGYSYDDVNYTLTVWYHGKSKSIYQYYLVYPTTIAQIFNEGGSIGLKARNTLGSYRKLKLR